MRPERRSGAPRGEDGTVVILYSVAMLMFIGLLALVLDAGALRYDARNTQSVADMAVVAGTADLLEDVDGNPQKACETAAGYVLDNIGETDWDRHPCFDEFGDPLFVDLMAACRADPSMLPIPGVGWTENYQAEIYWPVPEGDLLDDRYDPDIDGESPCDRIAVKVFRARGFVFGGAIGAGAGALVGSPAVARATIKDETKQAAALVVLDPYNCNVLIQSGSGGGKGAIHVFEDDDGGPGIIQVDSDATNPSTCKNTNQYVMDAAGDKSEIKAGVFDDNTDRVADDLNGDGRSDVRNGFIFTYALVQRLCPFGSAANNWCAYEADDVPSRVASGSTPDLKPVAGERATRDSFEHQYDCRPEYVFPDHVPVPPCERAVDDPADPEYLAEAHITNLRTEIRGHIAAGTIPDDPADDFPDFTAASCDPATWAAPFPSGKHWWFNCDLAIGPGQSLVIPDGNVVVTGGIDLKGILRINGSSSNDSFLYIGKDFTKAADGSLRLGTPSPDPTATDKGGTFVYLETPGRINMQGGTGTEFTWVAPYQGPFEDLALWSEYTNKAEKPHDLGGDLSNLEADGVYYMPNAKFLFRGSGEMKQQRAQFIAYRVEATGLGALRIKPDPERAVKEFGVVVNLIR